MGRRLMGGRRLPPGRLRVGRRLLPPRLLHGFAAGLALAAVSIASASGVSAHAYIEGAVPQPGTSVPQAPPQLRLTFTEPLDSSFSSIQVLDARRERVDRGDSRIAPDDPRAMLVSLGGVPDGVYTVAWRTLSSVDGHTVSGAYPLFIGVVATAGTAATSQTAEGSFSAETALARWWL